MNSGSYQLIINIKKNINLQAGKLGNVKLPAGYYIYTGSAMKNLNQRVRRHLSGNKKIKWHIDYLLAIDNVEIIEIKVFHSYEKEECRRNLELLHIPGAFIPVRRFGSSDCRTCKSHLIGIPSNYINKAYTMQQLSSLPNISKELEFKLKRAGIDSVSKFYKLGAPDSFLKIREAFPNDVCLSMLYALEGAIEGIRWHNLSPAKKKMLKEFYESLWD